jgi:hypothetical protein
LLGVLLAFIVQVAYDAAKAVMPNNLVNIVLLIITLLLIVLLELYLRFGENLGSNIFQGKKKIG